MPTRSPRTHSTAPLEAHLGFWLRFVSNHVSLRFRQQLEAHGITVTDWVALRTLLDRADCTHAHLIDALGMTKGAASKVVSRLEQQGLLQRHLAQGRARDQRLVLSPAGRALLPRLAKLADDNDAHFFGHLPAAEREALLAMLRALVQHHGLKTLPTS